MGLLSGPDAAAFQKLSGALILDNGLVGLAFLRFPGISSSLFRLEYFIGETLGYVSEINNYHNVSIRTEDEEWTTIFGVIILN